MPYIKPSTTTQTALTLLSLTIIALLPSAITAQYYSKTNENNFLQLQSHLSPGVEDVLENLDRYSKLYVSVKNGDNSGSRGNCVWSECGLDDQTDDQYMGDYRDGDEKWYKYRTQSFCANAAYSLYGIPKDSNDNIFSGKCNKKHFINSFFTYGGADTLLKSVGVQPIVYYEGYTYEGGNNNNNNNHRELVYYDDGYVNATNADCVEVDYEEPVEEEEEEEEGEEGWGDHRNLGSGSQDQQNDGYSSTLGCDADNKFIIGVFQGNSCDGNYYRASLDSVNDYNKQHHGIGCHQIWKDDGGEMYVNADYAKVYALLKRSWACDPRLYPNECPDPYREKDRFEYALQTAAHGGNGMRAYKNEELRKPLRITAWLLFSLTLCLLLLAYFIGNRRRMVKKSAGDRNIVNGAGRVIKEDVSNIGWKASLAVMMGFNSARDKIKEKINKGGDSFLDDCNMNMMVQPAESESDSVKKSKLDKALKDCRRYSGAESFHVVEKVDGVIQSTSSQPVDPPVAEDEKVVRMTISEPASPVENVTRSVRTENRKQEDFDDADGVLL